MWRCPICERKTALCDKEAHRCTSLMKAKGQSILGGEDCGSTDSNDENHWKNDYPTYKDDCEFSMYDDLNTDIFDNMSQMKL